MARRIVGLAALLSVLAVTATPFRSARPPVVTPTLTPSPEPLPERRVPDFTLRDPRGQEHYLAELADREAVVVVFLGAGCPLARAYAPRLAELCREFQPRGVAFLAIDANAQDSLADLATYAHDYQLPFPILKDPDAAVADAFRAERTPEAFLLDASRRVRYRGRIDRLAAGARQAGGRQDLALALDELLGGRPVSCPVTRVAGCRIGRLPQGRRHGDVTYSGQVARLLDRHCAACHHAGGIAPFPLTDYATVAGWSATLREVVRDGRMPPWFADPRFGHFRNDARLSDAEKDLLVRWIDDGCPEGEAAEEAPPPRFADGWQVGKPDRVLAMAARPFAVPADGEVRYQYFEVDPGFTEDVWVRAAEVRPGCPSVVHHALVLLVPPDAAGPAVDSLGALLDYAPGMGPCVLPDGMALRVPAGSRFLFQMHYVPDGSPHEDLTSLGLVFAEAATVQRPVRGGAVVNQAIAIPPGAADHVETAECGFPSDVLLLSLSPHLHLRGKAFRVEAVYPGGRREVLLDVPRYDFNWQLRYELAEPKRLPHGTRLVCTAHYDNSGGNPANPDPTRTVTWGDQTSDEMLIGFLAYVPLPP
jgi:peroxiredoxin